MRKSRWMLTIGSVLACAPAMTGPNTSVFTELSARQCVAVPASAGSGDAGALRCKGPAGFSLEIYADDDRASATVLTPDGRRHDLEYWHVVTGHFSVLGPRAEWRLRSHGGRRQPISVIVRIVANENPERPAQTTSYLAVARITASGACVTDRIGPGKAQNAAARIAADRSAKTPCRTAY